MFAKHLDWDTIIQGNFFATQIIAQFQKLSLL